MEHVTKQKTFLKPYTSVDDERFSWLLNTFLKYFENWKVSTQNRPGCFPNADKAKMFISWQTHESVCITSFSCIELIKFLLSANVQYVLTETFMSRPFRELLWTTTLTWFPQR